jgi:hypothetical protein
LIIYLPSNTVESIQDTVVTNASSDQEVLENSINNDSIDSNSNSQLTSSSSSSSSSSISFSMCNDVLTVEVFFEYLFDYFKYSLSMNNKPMNLEKILSDICSYIFIELKFAIDI